MDFNLTLKRRLQLMVGASVLALAIIGFLATQLYLRVTRLNQTADKVAKLELLLLELRKNEKDFLARDVISERFFTDGGSDYLTAFVTNMEEVELLCEQLAANEEFKTCELVATTDSALSLFQSYNQTFGQIVEQTKNRGYKDFGLEGKMRKSIHEVEKVVADLHSDKALVHVLMLRRHEKDFIIRQDVNYLNKFNTELESFTNDLNNYAIGSANRTHLGELLNSYRTDFNNLVETAQKIGLDEKSGLKGTMRQTVHLIEPKVAHIHRTIATYTAAATKLLFIELVAIIFVGAFVSLVYGYFISRKVYKQLGADPRHLQQLLEKIAAGDLRVLTSHNKNATGVMASLQTMTDKLKDIITRVHDGAAQIVNASEQLSNASEQIAQGASEQASSVEEISSTVEELSSNIDQNNSNAQRADQTAATAQDGINSLAESARETISSSHHIVQRIQVINEIAAQTNILALNAAVEAARAGSEGRGFAVVAGEVRKLAERSKLAASEIIALSKTSQKLSEASGSKLEQILPFISNTNQLVQEIASASSEQTHGIHQVNNALQQLNMVTQTNASISEEMASSAKEMENQAFNMKGLVEFFKV